jgi:hypothetical protein
MLEKVRRIVTGHDARGTAVIVDDAPARNVQSRPSSGIVSTLLWVTDRSPAGIADGDDPAESHVVTAPPPSGSILRVVDFPPHMDRMDANQDAIMKEMGIDHKAGDARSAFMHRTKSIDYALVLSGECDMLLDDTEVHMKAGDIMVQRGTNHAWVNRSAEWCRIAFVLIDSEKIPGPGEDRWTAG